MVKVYNIKDKNGNTVEIPSMELINLLQKHIENVILNISSTGLPSLPIEKEELKPVSDIDPDYIVDANHVQTDNAHQFVTKALLEILKDKPSYFELNKSITELKKEISLQLDDYYIRLVNTPIAMSKLKDISNMLQKDDVLSGFMDVLSSKVNMDQLQDHEQSKFHLDNNDRKALNLLLEFIKDGVVDWNAEPNSPNYIHNKPNSLPADGGNADTVQNNGACDIARREHDLIVGLGDGKYYKKETCDLCLTSEKDSAKKIMDAIRNINYGVSVLFKRGAYQMEEMIIDDKTTECTCISGSNQYAILELDTLKMTNITMRDIIIKNTIVQINSDCKLDTVTFKGCNILFYESHNCDVMRCKFENCRISTIGSFTGNMICMNRFETCTYFKYLGKGNVFYANIY